MYLSQLLLNPRSRQVQREIADPYEMHRTLMRAFPSKEEGGPSRVLFRVDTGRNDGMIRVLVQSEVQPDWSWCVGDGSRDYLLPHVSPNPQWKRWEPAFRVGQVLMFRLRANPTVKRNGKRFGLYRHAEQMDWLGRKAREGGFEVLTVVARPEGMARSYQKREDGRQTMQWFSVQFDGVLRVCDEGLFAEAIRCGIGSGKGLGFGLLSVARYA